MALLFVVVTVTYKKEKFKSEDKEDVFKDSVMRFDFFFYILTGRFLYVVKK